MDPKNRKLTEPTHGGRPLPMQVMAFLENLPVEVGEAWQAPGYSQIPLKHTDKPALGCSLTPHPFILLIAINDNYSQAPERINFHRGKVHFGLLYRRVHCSWGCGTPAYNGLSTEQTKTIHLISQSGSKEERKTLGTHTPFQGHSRNDLKTSCQAPSLKGSTPLKSTTL